MVDGQKRRSEDQGFRIRIPREVSIGSIGTMLGGVIFAGGLVWGGVQILAKGVQWYDGVNSRFDSTSNEISTLKADSSDFHRNMLDRMDKITTGLADLKGDIQEIKGELKTRHASVQ